MLRFCVSSSIGRTQPAMYRRNALFCATIRQIATCHKLHSCTRARQAPTYNRLLAVTSSTDLSSRISTCFSSTYNARRKYTTQRSFPDPDRPDLFYHLFDPPTPLSNNLPVFALSFLPAMPTSVDSCAVIGWLPAASPGQEESAGLNDFMPNGTCLSITLTLKGLLPRALCRKIRRRPARSHTQRAPRRGGRDTKKCRHPDAARVDAHTR